jgi:hypothetical protein
MENATALVRLFCAPLPPGGAPALRGLGRIYPVWSCRGSVGQHLAITQVQHDSSGG